MCGIFGLRDIELAIAIRGRAMFKCSSAHPVRSDGRLASRPVADRESERESLIDYYLLPCDFFGQHQAKVRIKKPAGLWDLFFAC